MRAFAASVLAIALPGAAAAHHSFFGRFDTQRLVELEGEVTEVLWRNPHAYFSLRADGTVWEIETSSLTVLKRMGIDEGTIRVGDRIRIAANPPAGDKKEMYARHVLLPDGRELLLNVGLAPRWTERDRAVGDESLLMAREGDPSRPDLGIFRVWSHTRTIARLFPEVTDPSVDINRYPLTPAARAQLAQFNRATDNPTANCVPKGMPTIMEAPYPIEFVYSPGRVNILIETYSEIRRIYVDGRALPEDPDPFFNGHSVGRWDGDTLVIDTIGISPQVSVVPGLHATETTRFRERITRVAPDRLVDEITITDPALFAAQVASLQAQTDRRWRCVITDDCSSPERFAALEAAVAGDDRFVVSRSERRLGFYRNFERAMTLAPPAMSCAA